MFEASENRQMARGNDTISQGHTRDCTPLKSELKIPNESDFMEHLRLIIEEWKHETGKEPNFLSCLNEFREKLFGINGCTVQEMQNLRQFFLTLLDFRNNDPVLLHCIKTVTHQIQRRQFQQQQQQQHQKDNMAFHSYNNIDRLAKALATFQVKNDHVPSQVIHHQQHHSNIPSKEVKSNNVFLGSSSITEVAKALANIQSNDAHSNASFIPMPPGWNERGERIPASPAWNGGDLTAMAHTLATMQFQQEAPKPITPPQQHGCIGSPPHSSPLNHMHSPSRNHLAADVEQLPIGAEMHSDWDTQQQRPHAHNNPNMYSMPPQSPEPRAAVPTFVKDAFPSPSDIGGDEFHEEEKPILRNTAWRAVGCTAKPPKAPETMAAILKKSLATEPGKMHYNFMSGQSLSTNLSCLKSSKADANHAKSADSSGANSVDIWESSEEECEASFDPLIDPRNPLQATSVWVGNLTNNIEKEMLYPHFMRIGYINNIVMVHENHCAFVNFENPRAAGRAMRDLQGLVVEGVKLLLRYPNRFLGGDHSVKLRDTTPVLPGRPKRGGPQVSTTSPKRPIKKHSK